MNYDQAKGEKARLEAAVKVASDAVGAIEGVGTAAMGLTPAHVQAKPEYQAARQAYQMAHARLAHFNGWFVKVFATEYRAERRARVAA